MSDTKPTTEAQASIASQAKPDHEAAARFMQRRWVEDSLNPDDPDDTYYPEMWDEMEDEDRDWYLTFAKLATDSAIGGLRLVSPTAIVIERDENGEWPEWVMAAGSLGLFRLDTYGFDIEFGQQVAAVLDTIEDHLASSQGVE